MYFVDLNLLHQRLDYIERQIGVLNCLEACPQAELERLAFERGLHMSIEAVVDVGNQMIDGFMMRDPGSYEDVVEILTGEKVLPNSEAESLKKLVACRKMLVQHYVDVNHEELWQLYQETKGALACYPERIRHYLEHHLGPVHAFRQTNT
ncbi:uncharacterized protein YutE (UPF0331/DUF86 family) [Caldalkalibacillus uzonensis]|uniref:Uncharacterized protein YutE (UPF0331/DUF86 family) n=1 Tax=Caldalkalibacillus uzonensis TaxID=353224 RepID=A0ABU0CP27_9BACI|nr:DUF86 domain-containing protein [Caldalkalibacillus uzonensis]MDQ0338168.1 uncharacterized protein YutE (UPF0331/DUF86 family) [Caldalkalibacillus uzonensis]